MIATMLLAVALAQTPEKPPASAAPYVKFEPQINAKPGEPFVVRVDTNLKYRKWTLPVGLTIIPPEHTKYGENAHLCLGPVGAYRFKLEGTFNDQWAEGETVVFVGQPSPVPPGPNPSPNADPVIVADLKTHYDSSTDPDKAAKKVRLVRLWTEAANQAVVNPGYVDFGQFCRTMTVQAAQAPFFLDSDDLKGVRMSAAAAFIAAIGPESTPLGSAMTDAKGNPATLSEVRKKLKAVLEQYAAALAAVK